MTPVPYNPSHLENPIDSNVCTSILEGPNKAQITDGKSITDIQNIVLDQLQDESEQKQSTRNNQQTLSVDDVEYFRMLKHYDNIALTFPKDKGKAEEMEPLVIK